MRKWEEVTSHFTQQTADVLLLQSSNVMRKLVSIHALTERSSWHLHQVKEYVFKVLLTVCKLAQILCIVYLNFDSLLTCLKLIDSVNCS